MMGMIGASSSSSSLGCGLVVTGGKKCACAEEPTGAHDPFTVARTIKLDISMYPGNTYIIMESL